MILIGLIKKINKRYNNYNKMYDGNAEELIIEFCAKARTVYEIMEYMGYKNRTRFRRDYIKPLIENGKLKMTIPNKPTSKNQKYITNSNE